MLSSDAAHPGPTDPAPPPYAEGPSALELSMRTGLPYAALRDFTLDRRLLSYVPLELARAVRVVPLLLVGDSLKLASAVPDPDLGDLRARFPYLTVDIVLAPGREIDLVLQRAQGDG